MLAGTISIRPAAFTLVATDARVNVRGPLLKDVYGSVVKAITSDA